MWREQLEILKLRFEGAAKSGKDLHSVIFYTPKSKSLEIPTDFKRAFRQHFGYASREIPKGFREPYTNESELPSYQSRQKVYSNSKVLLAVERPAASMTSFIWAKEDEVFKKNAPTFCDNAAHAGRLLLQNEAYRKTLLNNIMADIFLDCRRPCKYLFGETGNATDLWPPRILDEGAIVGATSSNCDPDEHTWLLFLHRLAYTKVFEGLTADKYCYEGPVSAGLYLKTSDLTRHISPPIVQKGTCIDELRKYSVLGSKRNPMDINLASSIGIQVLLEEASRQAKLTPNVEISRLPANEDLDPSKKEGRNMELRLREKLGDGGMADVWKATDKLGRTVAVKIVREASVNVSDALQHAKALARCKHPNVVTVFYVAEIKDPDGDGLVDCVVMEYVEGSTLRLHLKKNRITEADVKIYCDQLIDGLAHIHGAGIAHGDLHEENILISGRDLKIIDILYRDTLSVLSTLSRDARVERDLNSVRAIIHQLMLGSEIPPDQATKFNEVARSTEKTLEGILKALHLSFNPEADNTSPMPNSDKIKAPEALFKEVSEGIERQKETGRLNTPSVSGPIIREAITSLLTGLDNRATRIELENPSLGLRHESGSFNAIPYPVLWMNFYLPTNEMVRVEITSPIRGEIPARLRADITIGSEPFGQNPREIVFSRRLVPEIRIPGVAVWSDTGGRLSVPELEDYILGLIHKRMTE